MYFIYCEQLKCSNFKLNIKQFGLKFYSLNQEQRKAIREEYKTLYNKRNKIRDAIKNSDDGYIIFDYRKRRELENDEKLFNLIEMIRHYKIKPVFHKNFETFLDHIMVLEIDSNRLSKYIECLDFHLFVHQFINFHYVFDSSTKDKKRNIDISIPYQMKKVYREKNIPNFNNLSNEIIIKYLFNFVGQESYGCFYVNKSFEKYLLNISKFINKISSDELFKFIEIMELFFSNSRLSQNNILNDTLIIESLLVKKESNNIEKEFVLKTGIIYKNSGSKKYNSNEDLSNLLHYVYKIRSTIIHGSMERIFDEYNTFSQKIKSIDCPKFDNISKMKKKLQILHFTEKITYEFVNLVLIYWINNNDEINFLKKN